MKPRSILLILLAVMLLTLAILPPLLPHLVDTRQVKARLESVMADALGMPVAIRGELGLRLLPMPELRLGGLELGHGADGPLVSCREVRLSLSLSRLLRREVLLRNVVLDDIALRLSRGSDGRLNLQLPQILAVRIEGAPGGERFTFQGVNNLSITGSLLLVDASTGMRLELEWLHARYRKGREQLSLSGALRMAWPEQYRFPRLEASVNAVGGLKLEGRVLRVQGFDVQAGLVLQARDGTARTGTLSTRFDLDTAAGTFGTRDLEATLGELRLTGSAQGMDILSEPVLSASLQAEAGDAAALAMALGLPTPTVAYGRQTPVQAWLELEARSDGLDVRKLRLSLGESEIAGQVSLLGWAAPAWKIELNAARLNLDELRPAVWPEAEEGTSLEAVLGKLRALRLDLDLRADELVAYGLLASRFRVALQAKDGVVQGRVAQVAFPGGRYRSSLRAEIGPRAFFVVLDGRLSADGQDGPGGEDGPLVLRETLRFVGAPEEYTGSLNIPSCDLRELFRVLGVEPPANLARSALRQAALNVTFAGGADGLRMPAVSLELDGMRLNGSGSIDKFSHPRITLNARTKRLNLGPYLPALAAQGEDASASEGRDLGRLPTLHPACPPISVRLLADEALLPGLRLGALRLALRTDGKSLRLDAESSEIMEGRATARLDLDGQDPDDRKARLTLTAKGVDARQTLQLFGQGGLLSGRLDGRLNAEADAGSLDALLRSLRLNLEAEAHTGRLIADRPFSRIGGKLILTGDGDGGKESSQSAKAQAAPYAYRCALTLSAKSPDPALTLDLGLAGGVRVDPDTRALTVASAGLRLSAKGSALHDERNNLSLRGNLSLDTAKGVVELADLVLSGPGLSGQGMLRAEDLGGNPSCSGSLRLAPFNPRESLQRAGIALWATRDPTALSSASATTAFRLRNRRLDIPKLELELDGFRLAGNAHIPDMDKPQLLFDLAGTSFNLDRYRLPPRTDRHGPAGKDEAVRLPLEAMSKLAFKGRLRLERLELYRLLFEHGEALLEAADGVYVAKPVTAEFYKGPARGEFKAVVTPAEFSFETQASARNVSFGVFLDAMAGGQYVRGPTDVYLTLRAHGATNQELVETLNGSGRLEVTDGSISFSPDDDPPDGEVLDLPALSADGGKLWEIPEDVRRRGRTRFSTATANVAIVNGVARNTDLLVSSPFIGGTGSGFVDMNKEIVDYTIIFEMLNAARVPLYFEGDFDHLDVGVRTLGVIGNTATGIVRMPFDILFGILPGIERLIPTSEPKERRVQ
ncbi:AsmA family protein [Desulfocurvibacter africanus]|uniref:AsmA family protein n=1 Tax=Desulfocurvibacter africanus TaxID=873 RepID=UPI002FD9AF28